MLVRLISDTRPTDFEIEIESRLCCVQFSKLAYKKRYEEFGLKMVA
jgi:hypothetical protein